MFSFEVRIQRACAGSAGLESRDSGAAGGAGSPWPFWARARSMARLGGQNAGGVGSALEGFEQSLTMELTKCRRRQVISPASMQAVSALRLALGGAGPRGSSQGRMTLARVGGGERKGIFCRWGCRARRAGACRRLSLRSFARSCQ